jgi:hypothetical protein
MPNKSTQPRLDITKVNPGLSKVKGTTETIFGDEIISLQEQSDAVEVQFRNASNRIRPVSGSISFSLGRSRNAMVLGTSCVDREPSGRGHVLNAELLHTDLSTARQTPPAP